MARYDKYDGVTGGFRAPAAADAVPANYDLVRGYSLDATGKAVSGAAGNSGFVGVSIRDRTKRRAGDILDIMTHGEIVNVAGLAAGTTYFLAADGTLTTVAPAVGVNGFRVGHTVEADRLVVRFERVQG